MSRIIVLGASGRAGRTIVAEALRRGHEVTSFVRDEKKAPEGTTVVGGDGTDAAAVARAVAGHDVAVNTVASIESEPIGFFTAVADALIATGVPRLVHVTLATLQEMAPGKPLLDAENFPEEYRPFSLGHAAGLARLAESSLDWTAVSPTTDFDHESAPSGSYRVASLSDLGLATLAEISAAAKITYPDFALGVLDEIESPRHRKVHFGLTAKE